MLAQKWAYIGVSLNELGDLHLYCTPAKLAATKGVCAITSGQQTINALGMQDYTMGGCAGLLVLYIVFCRFVAFLGVRYIKW